MFGRRQLPIVANVIVQNGERPVWRWLELTGHNRDAVDSTAMTEDSSRSLLERNRFEPERAMQAQLYERFGLAAAAKTIPEQVRHEEARSLDFRRAAFTRLTARIAPGLTALLTETMERLELQENVELYVDPSPEVNAFAHCGYGEDDTWVVTLTSGAVRLLSDDHLRFLLGHELGHHAFGHGEFAEDLAMIYRDTEPPALLVSRVRVLDRLQELSADRAAALAAGGDISTSAEALLRIATGLGPEDLRLDLGVFLDEIDRLQAFDIPDYLGYRTHPLLPVRIRALQLHLASGDHEQEILTLARLMDREARDERSVRARDLLLAGGLLAAHSDGDEELSDEERSRLVALVLPFTDDPEGHLTRLGTHAAASALYVECAAWIRENVGPERYEWFGKLAEVVLFDNRATDGECAFLMQAAEFLDIPSNYVQKSLDAHAESTARQPATPIAFGLRE